MSTTVPTNNAELATDMSARIDDMIQAKALEATVKDEGFTALDIALAIEKSLPAGYPIPQEGAKYRVVSIHDAVVERIKELLADSPEAMEGIQLEVEPVSHVLYSEREDAWKVEVYRLEGEAEDEIHIDIETFDVFDIATLNKFGPAVMTAHAIAQAQGTTPRPAQSPKPGCPSWCNEHRDDCEGFHFGRIKINDIEIEIEWDDQDPSYGDPRVDIGGYDWVNGGDLADLAEALHVAERFLAMAQRAVSEQSKAS